VFGINPFPVSTVKKILSCSTNKQSVASSPQCFSPLAGTLHLLALNSILFCGVANVKNPSIFQVGAANS
jgi:hypothetical protein